jgi:predicted dehydrogenase
MVESGDIGTPLRIAGRGKCDHRGGGEDLIVLGTHILDLQTFFFGAPECVMADVRQDGRPIVETDRRKTMEPLGAVAGDSVFAYFRFPGDVIGTFESRHDLFNPDHKIVHMGVTVTGTKGSLSMRFNDNVPEVESKLRISRFPVPLVERRTIPGAESLDYSQCGNLYGVPQKALFLESNRFAAWDLMRSIEEDRPPVSNASNARLALEMIYGVYASALSGKAIDLPLANRAHPLEAPRETDL